jgi:hypothetical protein
MNETISDEENDYKWIERYGKELHITLSELCRSLKCPSSICKKSSNGFKNKSNRRSNQIMHVPELDKVPDEQEIQEKHDGTYQYIAEKLNNSFVILS